MAEDNSSRVIRLSSNDFKYNAIIGVFAGRAEITVFESAVKSGPVVKHLFSFTTIIQFRTILRKILADPESQPIELDSWPWNRDLKQNEFKSSVKVGRDNEKCIYFDMTSDKHKEPIRLYLVTDKSYRINGSELPKVSLTEAGANTIIEIISALINAAIIIPGRKSGEMDGGGSGGIQTFVPTDPPPGQDVPF